MKFFSSWKENIPFDCFIFMCFTQYGSCLIVIQAAVIQFQSPDESEVSRLAWSVMLLIFNIICRGACYGNLENECTLALVSKRILDRLPRAGVYWTRICLLKKSFRLLTQKKTFYMPSNHLMMYAIFFNLLYWNGDIIYWFEFLKIILCWCVYFKYYHKECALLLFWFV